MTLETTAPGRASPRAILVALGLAAVTLAVEYASRRVAAPALPVLASPSVNDMLASGAAYIALSVLLVIVFREAWSLPGGPVSLLGRRQPWMGAIAALAAAPLAMVDRALWGSVRVPSYSSEPNETVLLAGVVWLAPVVLVAVNGVVIPIAEEWIWRGLVQPRLVGALGAVAGIGLTAVLFSFKHAVVDASLGRLSFIVAGGVVLGLVARSTSWQGSAISHVVMNTVATVLVLLAQPRCLSPQPELTPEVRSAVDGTVALLADPGEKPLEPLFTPDYLAHFPDTARFLADVRASAGRCTWRCAVQVDGPRKVTGLLACEKRPRKVTIGVEKGPPHRVNLLSIQPADEP